MCPSSFKFYLLDMINGMLLSLYDSAQVKSLQIGKTIDNYYYNICLKKKLNLIFSRINTLYFRNLFWFFFP